MESVLHPQPTVLKLRMRLADGQSITDSFQKIQATPGVTSVRYASTQRTIHFQMEFAPDEQFDVVIADRFGTDNRFKILG